MSDLVFLVPVLNRPHRVAPLLKAIEATTPGRPSVLFLADSGDDAEIAAIEEHLDSPGVLVLLNLEGGSYAEKINRGVAITSEPWLFLGADDLEPQAGWLEAASAAAGDGPSVVGVNDLIPRRRGRRGHATHFLMSRSYAELPTVDGGEGPLHAGYHHWCVDDELIATATARGAYAYAPEARVEHLHPMAGNAGDDATYRKGRSRSRQDRDLFRSREALWA